MSETVETVGKVLYSGSGHNGPPVEPHYDDRYLHIFSFEKYDHTKWHDWMHRHWDVSLYASGIYVALIFLGQYLMRNRQPFEVRRPLLLWNIALAAFSATGFFRSIPELWYEWTVPATGGLQRSVCFADNHNIATSLWGLLFAWSKLFEFGDTVFIVLKKQPLIFLHWYHHVTVTIYCWFAYSAYDPSSRWFCTMNYLVHSLMYTYYAMKVLQIKIPRHIPMTITICQIMQMVVGVIINVNTYYIKLSGQECKRPYSNIHLAFAMYTTYFILFANFFRKSYFRKKSIKSS
ncbi:unnamed protein product [Orchesella dallaii]|uniref:Elongation of very long chain fatty acids protein n=1 Tax=Orchesella dallaii TaxID=48710 RepID=A0ABP1PLE5_9HEXA